MVKPEEPKKNQLAVDWLDAYCGEGNFLGEESAQKLLDGGDAPQYVLDYIRAWSTYNDDLERWKRTQPYSMEDFTSQVRLFDGELLHIEELCRVVGHYGENRYSVDIFQTYEKLAEDHEPEDLRPLAVAIYKWYSMRRKIDTDLVDLFRHFNKV